MNFSTGSFLNLKIYTSNYIVLKFQTSTFKTGVTVNVRSHRVKMSCKSTQSRLPSTHNIFTKTKYFGLKFGLNNIYESKCKLSCGLRIFNCNWLIVISTSTLTTRFCECLVSVLMHDTCIRRLSVLMELLHQKADVCSRHT